MRILNKIVIPRIQSEWDNVAYSMDYDLHIIKTIERDSHNVQGRCQKLFTDWLTTCNGPTPKTWKTLLDCIEEVPDLTSVLEKIKAELVKGNESTL